MSARSTATPRERNLRNVGQWYHTFELPGGLVSDGYFELRRVVGKLPLPASLEGRLVSRRGRLRGVLVVRARTPGRGARAHPARALRAIRGVMRPGAELLSLEATSLALTVPSRRIPLGQLFDRDEPPHRWTPHMAAHRRLLITPPASRCLPRAARCSSRSEG